MKLVLLASGQTVDWNPSGGTPLRGRARFIAAQERANAQVGKGLQTLAADRPQSSSAGSGAAPDLTGGARIASTNPSASLDKVLEALKDAAFDMNVREILKAGGSDMVPLQQAIAQKRRELNRVATEQWNADEIAGKHNHGYAEQQAFYKGIEDQLAAWLQGLIAQLKQAGA